MDRRGMALKPSNKNTRRRFSITICLVYLPLCRAMHVKCTRSASKHTCQDSCKIQRGQSEGQKYNNIKKGKEQKQKVFISHV